MGVMKVIILREWVTIFVAGGTRNTFWWTSHIMIVITIIFYGMSIVLQNISATPYRRSKWFHGLITILLTAYTNRSCSVWDVTVPGTTRLNPKATPVAGATVNIVLDLITLIIPQRVIWSLNVSKKKKIGVSLVFTIGLL